MQLYEINQVSKLSKKTLRGISFIILLYDGRHTSSLGLRIYLSVYIKSQITMKDAQLVMNNSAAGKVGYWSALLSVIFGFGYSIPQILSTLKIIPHPQDLFWLFLPSLFLAPAFLVAMICLDFSVNSTLKIWTTIGWAFAAIYCTMVTLVYFSQLAVVLPQQFKGVADDKNLLLFESGTFLMSVDCLGYFFMSLSSFFAAFAFANSKHKWLYRGLLLNGSLMPLLVLAFFYPVFYYIGAVWMITFPLAMINAIKFFRDDLQIVVKLNIAYENK